MLLDHVIIATASALVLISAVYTRCGWREIFQCYSMWLTRRYWTNYNIIEAASWVAKAMIIIPGLIFGVHVWQLYFVALFTSMTLIWASNKKLLPTLVGFNTMWIWLSCMVLSRHLFA